MQLDLCRATPHAIAIVDGWPINVPNLSSAVSQIIQTANQSEGFAVFTLNLDHLDKLRRSASFRHAYAKAKYVTADGAPVAMLASRQGTRVERTTGSDLVLPLATAAARESISIYLYGTTADILASATLTLKQHAGFNLVIAGTDSPAWGFEPDGPEADAALERIEASGARLCLVALGAPKQELFAARAVERGTKIGFVCIGAGLDFLSGAQIRAPQFMQSHGLEWLWRLALSPRRLASRYFRCALLMADLTLPLSRRIAAEGTN
jgi:exopolysaccharide biosynthesis WecB/TagA/CpsF family protein